MCGSHISSWQKTAKTSTVQTFLRYGIRYLMGKQSKNKKHCDTGSLENNEKEGVKVQLLNDEQLFCSTAKFTCRNCYISFLFKGEST